LNFSASAHFVFFEEVATLLGQTVSHCSGSSIPLSVSISVMSDNQDNQQVVEEKELTGKTDLIRLANSTMDANISNVSFLFWKFVSCNF
jgi:hypothetical protein